MQAGRWRLRRLQYKTLSMGLTVAPEIATKLFSDVLKVLRELSFKVAIKVDDLIAADADHPAIDQAMPFTGEEIYAVSHTTKRDKFI